MDFGDILAQWSETQKKEKSAARRADAVSGKGRVKNQHQRDRRARTGRQGHLLSLFCRQG